MGTKKSGDSKNSKMLSKIQSVGEDSDEEMDEEMDEEAINQLVEEPHTQLCGSTKNVTFCHAVFLPFSWRVLKHGN